MPDIASDWDRVIAINPVECRDYITRNFTSASANTKRMQLHLIPASALTVHKSQGLNKNFVLFNARFSSMLPRGLSYVALSRCKGLHIIGDKIRKEHY